MYCLITIHENNCYMFTEMNYILDSDYEVW